MIRLLIDEVNRTEYSAPLLCSLIDLLRPVDASRVDSSREPHIRDEFLYNLQEDECCIKFNWSNTHLQILRQNTAKQNVGAEDGYRYI